MRQQTGPNAECSSRTLTIKKKYSVDKYIYDATSVIDCEKLNKDVT